MTKPAQFVTAVKPAGRKLVAGLFPNSDKGRDGWSRTAGSDTTSTPFDLGVITQLNDSACSCTQACGECLLPLMRLGEGCHMIGSPSGELLKKPPQQSGQGHALALMPKEKREVCKCVCAYGRVHK